MPFVLALLLAALVVPAAGAAPGGGTSPAAKACQQGGYANYVRSDVAAFKNSGDCVSYAAQGGPRKPEAMLTVTFLLGDYGMYSKTVTGSGLEPGSVVNTRVTGSNGLIYESVYATVDVFGTFTETKYSSCAFVRSEIISATTAAGGTITVDASPSC